MKVKSIGDIAAKWSKETPARQAYYASGIASPTKDWSEAAQAAEVAYDSGVTAAVGRKAFSRGVREAGTEKWQRKARDVGVPRFAGGVMAAGPDYSAKFGPYRDALEAIVLPARGARGDPGNVARVTKIADELHKRRVSSGK